MLQGYMCVVVVRRLGVDVVAYLLIATGMTWCSMQDLKSCTVTLPPLLLWCAGSVIHVVCSGVGWGLLIAAVYFCLLYRQACFADWLAISASVAWFDIPQAVAFFFATAFWCLALYFVRRQPEIPMMPCIMLGWCVVHWFDALTYGCCALLLRAMNFVSVSSASVAQVCEQYVSS